MTTDLMRHFSNLMENAQTESETTASMMDDDFDKEAKGNEVYFYDMLKFTKDKSYRQKWLNLLNCSELTTLVNWADQKGFKYDTGYKSGRELPAYNFLKEKQLEFFIELKAPVENVDLIRHAIDNRDWKRSQRKYEQNPSAIYFFDFEGEPHYIILYGSDDNSVLVEVRHRDYRYSFSDTDPLDGLEK